MSRHRNRFPTDCVMLVFLLLSCFFVVTAVSEDGFADSTDELDTKYGDYFDFGQESFTLVLKEVNTSSPPITLYASNEKELSFIAIRPPMANDKCSSTFTFDSESVSMTWFSSVFMLKHKDDQAAITSLSDANIAITKDAAKVSMESKVERISRNPPSPFYDCDIGEGNQRCSVVISAKTAATKDDFCPLRLQFERNNYKLLASTTPPPPTTTEGPVKITDSSSSNHESADGRSTTPKTDTAALSVGWIIGISVGCALVCSGIIVALMVWWFCYRKKKGSDTGVSEFGEVAESQVPRTAIQKSTESSLKFGAIQEGDQRAGYIVQGVYTTRAQTSKEREEGMVNPGKLAEQEVIPVSADRRVGKGTQRLQYVGPKDDNLYEEIGKFSMEPPPKS
uniref:Uncharacterized protein n=1 Tax=Ditylenchus dipsaci TaxID=166011 RepID=A0A915DVV9_9BILA